MPTVLEQLQYGFDRNSRRTWQRRSLTDTQDQRYGYDSLGQVSSAACGSLNVNLTAISGRPADVQSWDYDPTGNWRGYHVAANGMTTLDQHRVHDRGNRLTQIEGNPNNMILDRAGRMRQMAPDADGDWDGKLEITWDAWSRITSVKNNGEVVGDYAYDGSHRRITREVDSETLHSYYNDAWRPVEERKEAETTASISYLWGARHRDDLARRDRAVGGTTLNETRYVLMDYFNPAAITDEAGEVKERYAFSAFGLRTILNPDFTVSSSSECGLEFAFQGQFLDAESGLMNYGYRYYSPPLGRWTCKDPIEEDGGGNLYEMAENNSINWVDYLGLLLLKFKTKYGPEYGKCGNARWDVDWIVNNDKNKAAGPIKAQIYQIITIKGWVSDCHDAIGQVSLTIQELWDLGPNGMGVGLGDTWSEPDWSVKLQNKCAGQITYAASAVILNAGLTREDVKDNPNLGLNVNQSTSVNRMVGGSRPNFSFAHLIPKPNSQFQNKVAAGKALSNVVQRMWRFSWNCCGGAFANKTTKEEARTADY